MPYKCFSDTFSNAKELLKLQNNYYLSAALDFDNIYNKTNYIWFWVKKTLSISVCLIFHEHSVTVLYIHTRVCSIPNL